MISQQASQVTLTSSPATKGSSDSKGIPEGELGAFGTSGCPDQGGDWLLAQTASLADTPSHV